MSQEPLRVGLIGGGRGAFIVQPHQRAIHMGGTRRIVAGALHQDPAIALDEAAKWPYPITGYGSYGEMLECEKLDYVLIVTPNHVHFAPAMMAVERGISVFCEKPLTTDTNEALTLAEAVNLKNVPFAVAHTYLGHWTTRLARHIVRSGLLGKVRWVKSEYLQGWLAGRTEDQGVMQAQWRVNPKQAGKSCCGGDIGTHAFMQMRYITGLDVEHVVGFTQTFVPGRELDDHFTAYCELSGNARALIHATQIAIGHKNDMSIEVNGEKGTLRWRQEASEELTIHLPNQPDRVYWRGAVSANDGFLGELPADLMAEPTIPSGHPQGFHDAFELLHSSFERDVRAYKRGEYKGADGSKYATVEDGVAGLRFLDAVVESQEMGNYWNDVRA